MRVGHEAVVARIVHGRRQAHHRGAHALRHQCQRRRLRLAGRGGGRIGLSGQAAHRQPRQPGRHHQRPARAGQRRAHCRNGGLVGGPRRRVGRKVVDEGRVDDALGGGRPAPQAVEVVERAPVGLGPSGGQRPGGLFRAGEAQHLVARAE